MTDTRSQLTAMLQQLAGALRSTELYPQGHPAVHTPLRHIASMLAVLLRDRDRIILGLVDDVLVLDEIPFYDAPTRFKAVYSTLTERKVEAIHFLSGISLTEIEHLALLLSPRGPHAGESVPEAAKHYAMPHVSFVERVDDETDPRARARATYDASLGIVVDLMSELRLGRIPSSTRAVQVIDDMRDIILTDESALLGLTLLKSYDNYTYNHSVNVAIFCLAFGKQLGLDADVLRRVGLGGLLHDVGKARTCEDIVKKPGALTDEEMRVMQRHPQLGAEITEAMRGIDRETGEIVLHHHIRFDGTGYPLLPAGREVHPHSQIVGARRLLRRAHHDPRVPEVAPPERGRATHAADGRQGVLPRDHRELHRDGRNLPGRRAGSPGEQRARRRDAASTTSTPRAPRSGS